MKQRRNGDGSKSRALLGSAICRLNWGPSDMDEHGQGQTYREETDLRETMGEAMELAEKKCVSSLDKHCKAFIERSPFLCIGTSRSGGRADVSPRGDPPGFVQILDDNTLFIPDRPGNNRLDTMTNIIENPNVGLLFLVPGFDDTLRVNGKATIIRDDALAQATAVNGKEPKVGIKVEVQEAFLHCAKAFKRSRLWDEESKQDRRELPSLGRIILEQMATPEEPPTEETLKETDEFVEENYRTELY